ncbi:DNA-protecting protein DprA [Kangiella profundi]|uniref:DNA-protecting protein DprA n=1 Tax=Kangiella profundi TaxID=1561924 RepID=A0A2K9AU88_9GAMM|nr:DNA-processing protein DprA [Kangiella profundi]AUD79983.1 DNA-protecting protein DprA [Kangiella profundi]GGE93607.1 DNA protecting protein DprA [Kangiella profundi]
MEQVELRHWLALSHINIGANKLLAFLEAGNSLARLFELSDQSLQEHGFRPGLAKKLGSVTDELIDQDLEWFDSDFKHLIPITSKDYPALLKEIPDPPKLLFVHGDKSLLKAHQIAIVGSRNPTAQGKENTREFAKTLASAGAVITSGMALGVDGIAHQAALDNGQTTIAVVGTGLDRIYPARHKELAIQISQQGALVSEFPLGTPVKASNFPVRNRIICGMSLGTLVVEAAIRSGSLITARLAMEQGREVFAIPGSIHNTLARGCHSLIKQGAKLVETAEEIIEELGALATWQTEHNQQDEPQEFVLEKEYQDMLEFVDDSTTSVDTIIQRSGLEIEVVSHMLLLLELNNYIASVPGGYQRVR